MGLDEIHPGVLKEPADEAAKPLPIISEKLWQPVEAPTDWKRGTIAPIFKKGKKEDPGNYRPVSLTSAPGKIMEQILLKVLLRHMENKGDVIGGNQHGFTKDKACLTDLVASYGITISVDKGRATDIIYRDFCKALETVLHNLTAKLEKKGSDRWITHRIRNWLNGHTERIAGAERMGVCHINLLLKIINTEVSTSVCKIPGFLQLCGPEILWVWNVFNLVWCVKDIRSV